MFREYLHRSYEALTRGRTRRAPKITRRSRPAAARLAIEGLEERTLLSTLTLTNGALVYTPSTTVSSALTISADPATHHYTLVDTAEDITLVGSLVRIGAETTVENSAPFDYHPLVV